jgi:hypothetical protein
MLDRQRDPRQRNRPPIRRESGDPGASGPKARWLALAVVALVALIAVARLRRPAPVEEVAATPAADSAPRPAPVAAPPAARPLSPGPEVRPVVETPTLDLMVRLEARRRIQRAGGAVYLDSLLAESDSVLWRWPERPGQPVTVAIVQDSLYRAAGSPEALIRDAFGRWQALRLGIEFAFISDTSAAEIVVDWLDRFPAEDRRTGQTDLDVSGDGTLQRARISLALHDPTGARMDRGALLITAIHEAGHAIGLSHSGRPGDVMFPGPTSPALSDRDRQTALLIYGLPAGSVKTQ